MRVTTFLLTGMLMCVCAVAHAQESAKPDGFSIQALNIVIPAGPGGGSHRLGTTMGAVLEEVLGMPVNLIDKSGDNGRRALEYYATLPPNGYTILQHFDSMVSQFVQGKSTIDPLQDLVPIAIVQITFNQIYVREGDSRFPDWKAFSAAAKAQPPLKIAMFGDEHAMEGLILQMLNLNTDNIGIDRASERYLSLLQGRVDALIEQPGDVRLFLDKKLIRPLLNVLPQQHADFSRITDFADIPSKRTSLYRFRGFFVHAAVPPERLRYLQQAFKKAFDSDRFQAFNQAQYMDLLDSYQDTAAARALLEDAVVAYRDLLR